MYAQVLTPQELQQLRAEENLAEPAPEHEAVRSAIHLQIEPESPEEVDEEAELTHEVPEALQAE